MIYDASLDIEEIDLQFVNQVWGPSILGEEINPATINDTDGGVQCLVDGPDTLPKTIKAPVNFTPNMNNDGLKFELTSNDTGRENLYVATRNKNRALRREKKRTKLLPILGKDILSPTREQLLAANWMNPPKRIPNHKHLQLVLVVTDQNSEVITKLDTVSIDKKEVGMFFVPSVFGRR